MRLAPISCIVTLIEEFLVFTIDYSNVLYPECVACVKSVETHVQVPDITLVYVEILYQAKD